MKRHFFITVTYEKLLWGFFVVQVTTTFIHRRATTFPTIRSLEEAAKELYPKAKKVLIIGICEIPSESCEQFIKEFNS